MEENREELMEEETVKEGDEQILSDVAEDANKPVEEQKAAYKDPNEQWFTSNGNVGGTSGNYTYGQNLNQGNGYEKQMNQFDMGPLSMGEWLLTILIGMVPCLGLVVYCVWAFGSSGNLNRRNYCRAYLIMQVIGIALGLIFALFTAFFSFLTFGFF